MIEFWCGIPLILKGEYELGGNDDRANQSAVVAIVLHVACAGVVGTGTRLTRAVFVVLGSDRDSLTVDVELLDETLDRHLRFAACSERCCRFGPMFAGDIRRQRVSAMRGFSHWRWHLDEMYVMLNGEIAYLWRAVDHEGEILESYITKTRDKHAALTFMKKALKRHGKPGTITTDGLRSYVAAMKELGNTGKREVGRWANDRVENSHLSFRRRERAMLRFRRMKTLQKFASVHAKRPQSLQFRTPSRRSPNLEEKPVCRPGRVANPRELDVRA